MLESWHIETKERPNNEYFNPSVPVSSPDRRVYNSNPTKSDYQNYLWLFGGR